MKYLRRTLFIALATVIAAGLLAPFLRADRLRPRIQAALEAALNRPVHITSAVHLNLFTGPGFSVDDVLIDDDPAAGIEPFAHVESLRARVRLSSLFRGKLAFSSLYLDSPSVNLVKMPSGAWNIQPLLEHGSAPNSPHQHTVPDIKIRDGRLNLKFGDTKSVFYISGADVDVYPNESGDVVIRFSGAPARTDRGSMGLGQLSARGLLRSGPNGEDQLNMGLRLERTAILEVARLFNGRDLGVHGFAVANARLAGPLSKIEVTGDLNITDIHRWDLMPPKGEGWTLNYRGMLDMRGHHLELETVAAEGQVDAGVCETPARRLSGRAKMGRRHYVSRSSSRAAGGNRSAHGRSVSPGRAGGRKSSRRHRLLQRRIAGRTPARKRIHEGSRRKASRSRVRRIRFRRHPVYERQDLIWSRRGPTGERPIRRDRG